MKIDMGHVSRRPPWPLWTLAAVGAWGALILGDLFTYGWLGHHLFVCTLKRLTGIPCPTCGSTRGVISLLHGHPIEAWKHNPLVLSVLAFLAAALILRVTLGRAVTVRLSRIEQGIAWVLFAAAFLANWAYLIAYVG